MKDKYHLNQREMAVMEELWKSGEALTSMDLMKRKGESFPHPASLHLALNTLLSQELLEVSGLVLSGKKNARKFRPGISETEFQCRRALSDYANSSTLPEVALKLVESFIETPGRSQKETKDFQTRLAALLRRLKQ